MKILWQYFSIKIFYFLYYFSFFHFIFIHTRFISFFSFSCFSPPHKCPVSTPISIPPFFYFLFHLKNIPTTTFTSYQRERERLLLVRCPTAGGDRGRRKDKAGGDQRSSCSTTTSAAPLLLVLLPTTRVGQISLFFFFPYLLVLIQLYFKNWILFCVLCLDYVRNGENEK